jgi:RDD family
MGSGHTDGSRMGRGRGASRKSSHEPTGGHRAGAPSTSAMSSSRVVQRRTSPTGVDPRASNLRAPAASVSTRLRAFLLTCCLFVVTLGVGWMVWTAIEWRHGRTASYRVTGLRVVRRGGNRPIGLGRSLLRNAVCCTLLVIPTIVACVLLGVVFVMGASPPDDLLTKARSAPWDLLTGTEVLDERSQITGLSVFTPESTAGARISMN